MEHRTIYGISTIHRYDPEFGCPVLENTKVEHVESDMKTALASDLRVAYEEMDTADVLSQLSKQKNTVKMVSCEIRGRLLPPYMNHLNNLTYGLDSIKGPSAPLSFENSIVGSPHSHCVLIRSDPTYTYNATLQFLVYLLRVFQQA